jgi:rhomboid protease GluP
MNEEDTNEEQVEELDRISEHGYEAPMRYPEIHFTQLAVALSAINVVIFVLMGKKIDTGGAEYLISRGALVGSLVLDGEYWRLLTYMFLHASIDHVINNVLILALIGSVLEGVVGKIRFLIIYISGGVLAGAATVVINMQQGHDNVCVGASGAVFALVGSVAYIIIVNKGKLEGIGKMQIIVFAALSLYGGFVNPGVDNYAHIGGLVAGILTGILLYRRRNQA